MKNYLIENKQFLIPRNTLIFSSGPGTLVDPSDINKLNEAKNNGDYETLTIVNKNKNIHMTGNFNNFRLYMLALYDRFEIIPESIKILDNLHFSAKIRFIEKGNVQEIKFRSPYQGISLEEVKISVGSSNGYCNDGLIFKHNDLTENIVCDIKFLTIYGQNILEPIELDIRYIGIAKSKNRLAQDRLSEGHEKLQEILAELSDNPNKKCSIILYKFDDNLKAQIDDFPNTLEIIEASLIKYFQPPMNFQRKDFPNDSKSLIKKLEQNSVFRIITLLEEPSNCILKSIKIYDSKSEANNEYEKIKTYFRLDYETDGILFEPKHIIDITL